jgi:DNA-binding MarR family transcriptional regulator
MAIGRPQRVTLPTVQILAAFMSAPGRGDWFGLALARHTGLGAGTVLQCLYRLEHYGWVESRWEEKDHAARERRPPRRFYRLTAAGEREAIALLQQRMSNLLRLDPHRGPA